MQSERKAGGIAVCHTSLYSETCADLPPSKAQVCEYADPWHPADFVGGLGAAGGIATRRPARGVAGEEPSGLHPPCFSPRTGCTSTPPLTPSSLLPS